MSKKAVLWTVSVAVAVILTAWGMHAHDRDAKAGLVPQMPGIILGLLCGFALDNQIAVGVVTVAANAYFYYLVLSLVAWAWTRLFHVD